MRKINLTGIAANKGYPALANNPNVHVGLDFLQDLFTEIVTNFGVALDNQRFGPPIVLHGCDYAAGAVSAGEMYYTGTSGEIFQWNGDPIAGTNVNGWIACSWIPNPTDTAPNQTILSDGTPVSIHNTRILSLTYAAAPNTGNLPDFATFVGSDYVRSWVPTQIATNASNIALLTPGAWNGLAYQNSWGNYNNGFNTGRYRLEFDRVRLSGAITGGATATVLCTLPVGFRPANNVLIQIPGNTGAAILIGSILIAPSGNITITFPGSPTYISLENIEIPLT